MKKKPSKKKERVNKWVLNPQKVKNGCMWNVHWFKK